MKAHRYHYLYLPVSRFFDQLSPQTQKFLIIGKVTLICLLVGFEIAQAANLI